MLLLLATAARAVLPFVRPQQIQIELERPVGETLAGTRESVDQAWKVIADNEKILRQYWFIGGSAPTFYYNVVPRRRGTAFYAQAFADLKEGTDTKVLTNELQRVLDAELLDSRVIVRQLEQGPPIDSPIEIRVFGPDSKMLNMLGGEIRRILADSPHIVHTRSDFEETVLRVALDIDESAAVQRGSTPCSYHGTFIRLYTEPTRGRSILKMQTSSFRSNRI